MAAVFVQHVLFPVQHLTTPCAPHLEQFAVHVDDVVVSGPFVKIVDVLRDQQKTIPSASSSFASARCAAFGAISGC